MRYIFADYFQQIARDKKTIFMTGDLGFNAFEPLMETMQDRFINAGVAEHNMVTAASGLSYAGFKPWIYSIAPFVSIKVMEEIRNDICLPKANVKIIALGGGFDYAIAGPTHHALEDIALMMTMPNIKIFVPGFGEDLEPILGKMYEHVGPCYLRLTKAHQISIAAPEYKSLRRVLPGNKMTMVVLGSLIAEAVTAIKQFDGAVDLWVVSELPFKVDTDFEKSIKKTKILCVVEEHVRSGGLGQYISRKLAGRSTTPNKFIHLSAKGYRSGLYGSREFYLKENALDQKSIAKVVKKYLVA